MPSNPADPARRDSSAGLGVWFRNHDAKNQPLRRRDQRRGTGKWDRLPACHRTWPHLSHLRARGRPGPKPARALDAVKGLKTSELAKLHGVHVTQIGVWKKQLTDDASDAWPLSFSWSLSFS
jgi:hypothetical protein